jgi:hypothetical protein
MIVVAFDDDTDIGKRSGVAIIFGITSCTACIWFQGEVSAVECSSKQSLIERTKIIILGRSM